MFKHLVIALSLASGPVAACPVSPDHSDALADLFTQVQGAQNERDAQLITNQMWALWADAPDKVAQEVLDSGMEKRRAYDFLGAIQEFDRLIAYCPDYAEGYNQRAFVNFIRQEYELALDDLNRAIELSPNHVAAIAGKALTLMGLGQLDEGQAQLRAALKLNPWLPERRMVLPPKGDEL